MGSVIDAATKVATFGLVDPDLRGEKAANRAISAQDSATGRAEQYAGEAFNRQKEYLNPYADAGKAAIGDLSANKFDYQQDPGYQFRLSEGMKALNAAGSARGLSNSGRALKELTRYGQDFASNEYGNAYNRNFNRLNTLAGFGQNAANNLSNAAGQYGQQMGGYQMGMGNAVAASEIAKANRTASDVGQTIQLGTSFLTGTALSDPKSNYNFLFGGK